MENVYIVAAKRTIIGNLLGSLSPLSSVELGAKVVAKLIHDTKIEPSKVDELIAGQVLTAGQGQNPARQTAISAGLPIEVPAYTLNQVCGSGLQSVCIGAMSIASGNSQLVIAGGQESMSNAYHCAYIRKGAKMGNVNFIDTMVYDGLTDVFSQQAMGITAENIAQKYQISRSQQDEFSYLSQQKALAAQNSGKFSQEIIPIELASKKEKVLLTKDEFIRADTSLEGLAKLKPVFLDGGSVTAGNSSGINDGAAFVMLASQSAITKYNLSPLARVVAFAHHGVEPGLMGSGPIFSTKRVLDKAGWKISDLDLIESNEAFAAQSLCVINQLGMDPSIVNVNGGAIALGHPIGASGARILVTLLHEMIKRQAKKTLATLCVGGGMGVSMCLAAA